MVKIILIKYLNIIGIACNACVCKHTVPLNLSLGFFQRVAKQNLGRGGLKRLKYIIYWKLEEKKQQNDNAVRYSEIIVYCTICTIGGPEY